MEHIPNLYWHKNREVFLPDIKPIKNWQTGIKDFYKNKGKEKIEEMAEKLSNSLEDMMGKPEIKLRWDNKNGLDGISLGTHPGIYFENEEWHEHNLGTKTSQTAMTIILNYYKELSKYTK